MLEKIISGGQTGVDINALIVAKELGFKTGGWMPLGFINQTGKHPEFENLYNIKEHTSKRYQPRTALNVKESDGTLRIATNFNSAGETLTLQMIKKYKKPHLDIDALLDDVTTDEIIKWINHNNIKILNVAGNSERTAPGIGEFTYAFLHGILKCLI